eukprot:CAMPEP_0119141972 /NCGR_PEP_ID=MMETSP1310-20130426/31878_1 /TAXON_ID=464262 /ORGANISM="Genus nov. species nov., Strain RCC2339" /LENGTH=401 /DNA_ID=CAMNT_0007133473 /DNA_START=112 /DNA_END=1318 /DNA_ORIENTATION=+
MDPFHTGDEFESTRNINLALGRSHIASVAEESRAMVWPYNLSYSETGTAKPNVGKMAFSLFVNSRDRGVGVVTNQLTELFKARGVSPDGPFVDDEDYGESPVTYRTRDPKGGWLCVERLKDDPLSGPVIRVVGAGEDALAAARVAAGRCTSSCLLEHQECSGTRALPQVGGIDGLAVTWVMGAEAPGYVPGEPEPGRQGLFGVSVLFEMSLPAAAEADKEFLKEGVSPNVVGRGLVSFIDGSWSPAVGPTIEKLSIRKDYRGRGLIMNLYREMERWVLDHWTLDALDGKLHFKATQLTGSVIDETPTGNPISDTTLLYKMCGWAANTGSCGGIAGLLSSGRPSDEEATVGTGQGRRSVRPASSAAAALRASTANPLNAGRTSTRDAVGASKSDTVDANASA